MSASRHPLSQPSTDDGWLIKRLLMHDLSDKPKPLSQDPAVFRCGEKILAYTQGPVRVIGCQSEPSPALGVQENRATPEGVKKRRTP